MLKLTLQIISIIVLILPLVSAQVGDDISYSNGIIRVDGEYHLHELQILDREVFEIIGDTCYVKKQIYLETNDTLFITSDSCKNVKLYPETRIRVAGQIRFKDVVVTSYDPETGNPIELTREEYSKTRPYIDTRPTSRYVEAINSEFSHLGYYKNDLEGSRWGFALYGTPRAYIKNSSFHHNYFGFYTFNATNVIIEDSKIYSNLEYGLDFHDYSDNFFIYNNTVYDNGNHGIIFSKFCDDNTILGNKVFNNTKDVFVKGDERNYGTHGIMLHHFSNNNLIEGNELDNNRIGIYLMDSHNNLVRDNIIHSDLEEGIVILRSQNNTINYNTVNSSDSFSLYSYLSPGNKIHDNYFANGFVLKNDEVRLESGSSSINHNPSDETNQETEFDIIIEEERAKQFGNLGKYPFSDQALNLKTLQMSVLVLIALLGLFIESIYLLTKKGRKQ